MSSFVAQLMLLLCWSGLNGLQLLCESKRESTENEGNRAEGHSVERGTCPSKSSMALSVLDLNRNSCF